MKYNKKIMSAMGAFFPAGGFSIKQYKYDFATYAHAHIPDSELITFPSGGHSLLGNHEMYREVVIGFLKKHL